MFLDRKTQNHKDVKLIYKHINSTSPLNMPLFSFSETRQADSKVHMENNEPA